MIRPRDYQVECRRSVLQAFKENRRSLVVLPTGCGKTIVFSDIMRSFFPRRIMVVAHRQELIWQAHEKIKSVTGWRCDVEMGDYKAGAGGDELFGDSPVVVSTVQTLTAGGDGGGRIGRFKPSEFGLLVIDEAHHATSPSYKRVIDYFCTNESIKVLGVTATPDRADEEALGQVFETVAFDYEILDAIKDGWLVPINQQMVNIEDLDFSQIRTTAGDLNGADLARVMEAEKPLLGITDATINIVGDKRTLVFAASVAHAKAMSEIFNRYRPGMSAWVCGETDHEERRLINSQFGSGKIQILCNCGTHTEGFDSPGVECVVMARPTKSRSLYAQMVGRSTRPLPGIVDDLCDDDPNNDHAARSYNRRRGIELSAKPACLIIDFVGNSGRHKLITTADILGGKVSDAAIERSIARAHKSGKPVRMDELLDEEEASINEEARRNREAEERARKARLTAKATYSVQNVDPFDVFGLRPVAARGWDRGKNLTEKQAAVLRRAGIEPDSMPYSQAKQLLDEMFRRFENKLCTLKQAAILKKHGMETEVTMAQASEALDRIFHNQPAVPMVPPCPPPRRLSLEGAGHNAYSLTSNYEDDNIPF